MSSRFTVTAKIIFQSEENIMKLQTFVLNTLMATSISLLPSTGSASVSLFQKIGGPTFELDYGSAGIATVTARFIGPFGIETPDVVGNNVTGLDFDYQLSGDGTNLMEIQYRLTNVSASSSFNLGFIVKVDPDGNGLFSFDRGEATIGSVAMGEATRWEIDSAAGNINPNIVASGSLDNTNNCTVECDLSYALQWSLGILDPGKVAIIRIGLSDNGQSLSSNFLNAISVDNGEKLTLSGVAAVVPLPSALPLLFSGLVGIGWLGRRKA
jgi:hypothetical protein